MALVYSWGPRGFGDLGRMAIYFQGAGEPVIISTNVSEPLCMRPRLLKQATLQNGAIYVCILIFPQVSSVSMDRSF